MKTKFIDKHGHAIRIGDHVLIAGRLFIVSDKTKWWHKLFGKKKHVFVDKQTFEVYHDVEGLELENHGKL